MKYCVSNRDQGNTMLIWPCDFRSEPNKECRSNMKKIDKDGLLLCELQAKTFHTLDPSQAIERILESKNILHDDEGELQRQYTIFKKIRNGK